MSSKFTMVLLMNNLSKQWPNIKFAHLNPGAVRTKMTTGDAMPTLLKPSRNLFFSSQLKGASNTYTTAFSPKFKDQSGIYITGGRVKKIQYEISVAEINEMLA